LLGEVASLLTTAGADKLHKVRHVVQRSLRTKPAHLCKRLATDRAGTLKVTLLGVGAGKNGEALHPSPQVGWVAELD
jgi:hypothetical protein